MTNEMYWGLWAITWIATFLGTVRGYEDFVTPGEEVQRGSLLNSNLIQEWTPIESVITAGKRDYFTFAINSTYAHTMSKLDMLIFISGNLHSETARLFNSSGLQLAVWYSFDQEVTSDTSKGSRAVFSAGYMEALAVTPLQNQDGNLTQYSNLYLVIEAYNLTSNSPLNLTSETQDLFWNYTIGVSQYDLVFQWDVRSWIELVDSDADSALLVTGNVTTSAATSANSSLYDVGLYELYLYSYEDIVKFDKALPHSLRAVQNGPYLASSVNNSAVEIELSSSNRPEIVKSLTVRGGSVKEQFYITGLNHSTTYGVYLTKKISDNTELLSDSGGILFSKSLFTTMADDSCSLIFGLNFCDGVAYSVPTSETAGTNKTVTSLIYDGIASSLYGNFSKALQMVPCDTEKDSRFSPLRTCNDCANSYRNWLCAVTIPRCTTDNSSYYIHRDKTQNRNDFIDQLIQPIHDYYEILPCIDMCYNLAADCPPDFQFSCPSKTSHSELLYLSYNVYEEKEFHTCNYVGNSRNLHILHD
ncbi:LAQU0S07e00826g1_1 [Lachancea quebecensis]|uniref:LAQU0S07e00826g1_1 n=1 Tax=Lachancea quebecensis TaxID=1654605 RepID=A0A0P1KST7_9SACH|nr:LAQU0S07e00826g1_1 [Lachancea quebecensis]